MDLERSFVSEDEARAEARKLEAAHVEWIREEAKRQGERLTDELNLGPGVTVEFNTEPISISE
jgi:hypothetical protein